MRGAALLIAMTVTSGNPQTKSTNDVTRCSIAGNLEMRPFTSKIFHNTRMLRIWLPPQYGHGLRSARYPVLYLNDGQDLFNACTSVFNGQEWRVDETATDLINSGKIPPMIIVGIDNAGRRDRAKEYLPFPEDTLTPAIPKVYGKQYPSFLLNEVIPFINREYRTNPSPAATGIGGSSYGAGIALYTAILLPGRFGKLLLESPSLYAHDNYLLKRADQFTRWPAKVYVGVGSINEPVEDVHRLAEAILRHKPGDRLLVVSTNGGAHNANAWAERFPRALQFLYGK